MSKCEPQDEPKVTNNMSDIVKKNEPNKPKTELNKPKIQLIDMLDNKWKIMLKIDMNTSQNESKKNVEPKNMVEDKSDNLKSSKNVWYAKAEKFLEKTKNEQKLVNSKQQICAIKELKRSLGKQGS
eukprot:14520114-Ditylum_brightwellii.AAC.1